MIKSSLQQIEKKIERIKIELSKLGPMRPGSLTQQYKDPTNQAGGYYQISYTLNMKSRTEYVRKDCVNDVKRQIKNYNRYKELNAEWVALSIEHSKLAMKLKREE